jgi:hypothetical protein
MTNVLTRLLHNDKSKTNWGESNDKLRDINSRNVGNELCYFLCANAVYYRLEFWERKSHARRNVHLRETELLRLPWLMICGHVSLYHQG